MKILYIDDDPDDRNFFRAAVRIIDPSIEFDTATHCDEAIFKLKSQKLPGLIFLDLNMPVKSGLECLKVIKANPITKGIPIVIHSTSGHLKDIDNCLKLGASKYIIKAGNFPGLISAIRPVIESFM